MNRNVSGIRATWLEAAAQIVNQQQLAAVEGQVVNQGEVIDSYGEALATKVGPEAVPTIAPLSQAINRRADPTFQLSDFMAPPMSGTDSRGDTVTVNPSAIKQGASAKGVIYYSFITPLINRAYEQLNFMVSEVSGTLCQMDIAVYVLDADSKILTRQVHAVDAAAGLPISESVVTITFPRWIAEQGSYVCIAWLQHGTGEVRSLLGLDETQRPLTDMVFPPKISAIGVLSGGYTALPETVDGSSTAAMDFPATWFTPYAELSEKIGDITRSFMEPWPDVGGDIDRPWVPLTARGIGSGGGYTAAYGTGMRVSIYDTPLASDHVRVSSSVYRIYQNQPEVPRHSTLIVRSSNDGRSGVGLTMNHQQYQLIEWANVSVDLEFDSRYRTVIYTLPVAPAEGDEIVVEYHEGAVDVWINGTQYVTAQAVGGPTAAAGRFVGIQNNRTGTVSFYISPWFGPWSARDLPQSDGVAANAAGG